MKENALLLSRFQVVVAILTALCSFALIACDAEQGESAPLPSIDQGSPRTDMRPSGLSDLAAPAPARDLAPVGPETPPAPEEPIDSCEAAGLQACFGSPDCPEDARCENVGSEALPTPCCVAGERGTRRVGELCDPEEGQQQCTSGLCIAEEESEGQARCSGACLEDSECPPEIPRCVLLPFDETSSGWCFPE